MYGSYLVPIVYMVVHGRNNLSDKQFGPWKMGRTLGLIVNLVAIAWLVLAIIFCSFPGLQPVTPQNMNYSTVVLSGWMVFGLLYFVFFGRHGYVGPTVKMDD